MLTGPRNLAFDIRKPVIISFHLTDSHGFSPVLSVRQLRGAKVLAAPPAEAVGGAFCGAGAELLGCRCCPRARSSCAAASPPFPLSSRWVYWGATVAAASPVPVAAEELLLLLI